MESLLGLVRHSGNAALLHAVEMSILSTLSGQPLHLHAEGLRGTGKTTVLRGARRLLPRIRRIQGCPYNCDPAAPHCPRHRDLDPEAVAALGSEWIPMPFLEISHSAKVGTVVGSIDLGRLVDAEKPEAALLPGTLPRAHRGIVFVDEINRLAETAPELADVLLDVMGTKPGRVQIEETGLPGVELTASISVWAASNPDEDPGPLEEIRRQLSDRFDFVIPTGRPGEAEVVAEILAHFEGTLALSGATATAQAARVEAFRTRMAARSATLREVEVPAWMRRQVAEIYARFGLESLRAVQAILWGVRLAACLADRREASGEDLLAVVPLALQHRVDGETLGRVLQYLKALPLRSPGEGGLPGAPGGTGAVPIPPASAALAKAEAAPRPAPAAVHPGLARPPAPTVSGGLLPRPAVAPAPAEGTQALAAEAPPAPAAGAGPAGTHRQSRPFWSRVLAALRGSSGPAGGAARRGAQGRGAGPRAPSEGPAGAGHRQDRAESTARPASPEVHPPPAPPHRARPLRDLGPSELVRTEAELRGEPGP